jgi:hypothetical protein
VTETATERLAEFEALSPGARFFEEAGLRYIFVPELHMWEGSTPEIVDCLLCLDARDGYPTRLFFSTKVSAPGKPLNWNGNAHILARNWVAYSWKDVSADQQPIQILLGHLDALR